MNAGAFIGVIYPHFLDKGIQYSPLFTTKKNKNLLSPAVNRGDLPRLNYSKTIFGRGYAHNALPDSRVK